MLLATARRPVLSTPGSLVDVLLASVLVACGLAVADEAGPDH